MKLIFTHIQNYNQEQSATISESYFIFFIIIYFYYMEYRQVAIFLTLLALTTAFNID